MKIIKFLMILTFLVYLRQVPGVHWPKEHYARGESIQISKNTGLVTLTSEPDMKGKKIFIPLNNVLIIIEK